MSKAYHITQWNPLYEKADTRKTDYMGWYCKQTKLVGIGIGKTMREPYPRNIILLGLWTMLETLASQSAVNERGWLIRGGVALDADGMADLIPTVPASAFQEAIDWFSQAKINWLEHIECDLLSRNSPELIPTTTAKMPTSREHVGKSSQSIPTTTAKMPTSREGTGRNSATDRQTDRQTTDRQLTEREAHAREVAIPTVAEVRAWAALSAVDPDYAEKKWRDTSHDHGWERNHRLIDWRAKWLGYWQSDKGRWLARKKSGGAAGEALDRTPAQARFEISRELEEVQARLEACHETSVRPDPADKAREKVLQQELKALEAATKSGDSVQT